MVYSHLSLSLSLSLCLSLLPPTTKKTGYYLLRRDADLDNDIERNEYTFDVVYVCTIAQILSVFSEWFWGVMLLIPLYAFYSVWVSFIKPYWDQRSAQMELQKALEASGAVGSDGHHANRAERRKAQKEEKKKK